MTARRPLAPRRSPAARALPSRRGQQGITLVTAVIMLLLFGLVTVAAFRNTLSSSQAIGNMQFRSESIAAANDTIEMLLSSDQFATAPTAVTTQMNATPNTVDITGDNNADISVTFPTVKVAGVDKQGPQCVRYRPVATATLDASSADDRACMGSTPPETGLGTGSEAGGSVTPIASNTTACYDTDWTITVEAKDNATNTAVQVTQGVQLRRERAVAEQYCK